MNASNLPGRAVARLAVAAGDPQSIYAAFGGFSVQTPGAPGHVFQSSDGGTHWVDLTFNLPDVPFGTGMPYALVTDLKLNPRIGLLADATFGRSVWVMPMP